MFALMPLSQRFWVNLHSTYFRTHSTLQWDRHWPIVLKWIRGKYKYSTPISIHTSTFEPPITNIWMSKRSVGAPWVMSPNVFGTKGGQLEPPLSHITFLDQWRSVGAHSESRHVFWTKRCQLGAPMSHITFLDQRRSVRAPPSSALDARSETLNTP